MQITPGTFVYYRTATPTTGAGPGLQPSEETTDRWSTGDRVEVGATGHQERFGVLGGEPDPEALAERRQRIGYSKEDLASLKARFAAYTERSHELTAAVEKAAAAVGVRPGHAVQIKVEVGSDGTVRVGGIDDAGKTRALERAIARDGDLFRGLRDFQELEQDLSTDLRAVTGMSLTDYRSRIASLQTGGGMDSLTGDGNTYDREQCLKLMDQDLYVVDNEFGQMISEHFRTARSGTVGVDISGDNNILEDAGGTVRDAFAAIMRDVSDYIRDVNDDLRKHYTDPEELKEKLVSLTNVSISLKSDGTVAIEGATSHDAAIDRMVQKVIKNIFQEALEPNPFTGERHDFFVAASYLLCGFDTAFSGEDENRKLETVFSDGRIESRISSPEEEARLREEILTEARTALADLGISGADTLRLVVDDRGKLVAESLPDSHAARTALTGALDLLNAQLEKRGNGDYNRLDETTDATDRLRGLLAKLDVFLPGGASALQAMTPAQEWL